MNDVEVEPRVAAPHAAGLLIAVPYRQAGLIALCALAGVLLAVSLSALHAPGGGAAARVQAISAAPPLESSDRGVVRLRLDPEPDFEAVASEVDGVAPSVAPARGAALSLDVATPLDQIDFYVQTFAPAAGRVAGVAVPAANVWPGLVAGLLMGLLLAALRELRGGRMRTAREAEWALGAPVLVAIPVLSAKARAASVMAARRSIDDAASAA